MTSTIFVQGAYAESDNAPARKQRSDYVSVANVDLWTLLFVTINDS